MSDKIKVPKDANEMIDLIASSGTWWTSENKHYVKWRDLLRERFAFDGMVLLTREEARRLLGHLSNAVQCYAAPDNKADGEACIEFLKSKIQGGG